MSVVNREIHASEARRQDLGGTALAFCAAFHVCGAGTVEGGWVLSADTLINVDHLAKSNGICSQHLRICFLKSHMFSESF